MYESNNRSEVVEVIFSSPFIARYIRIYPQTWNEHMSMRAGALIVTSFDRYLKGFELFYTGNY